MADHTHGPALHLCWVRGPGASLFRPLEDSSCRGWFSAEKAKFVFAECLPFDFVPHIAAAFYGLVRLFSWVVTFSLIYLWVALSLRRFPYTEPWGEQAGGYVLRTLQELGITIVESLPGLLMVFLVYILTRWLVRMANVLFDQVATGRINVSWMDADVAHATQRIFSAILWIFAIIIAYPYIPGSHTEAFKGLSVFFGLVISLGSTGIINQIMSGTLCRVLQGAQDRRMGTDQ